MRRTVLTTLAVALLVVAGCAGTGGPTTDPPGDSFPDSPTVTPSPTPTPGGGEIADNSTYVFDHADVGSPVIEGGLAYPEGGVANATYYATLVGNASDAERFDWSAMPEEAAAFVNGTDFSTASLVVVQAMPKSSVPDYRVESIDREAGTVSIRLNDSSDHSTTDITVETVLIRVDDGDSPLTNATITTQTGVTFDTSTGAITVDHDRDGNETEQVVLPFASDDPDENVDDPRDLTVRNTGDETNGYTVTVTGWVTPECRAETPTCGAPDERVTILHRVGKLRPGEAITVEDVIAREGTYTITVEASLPGEDGGRRLATDTFEWSISEYYFGAHVTVDEDDGVQITQAVQ